METDPFDPCPEALTPKYGPPLYEADGRGQSEMVELLLDSGVDVNYQEEWHCTALNNAIRFNRYKTARILLDRGANVNGLDPPLAVAAALGNMEIALLVLQRGADTEPQESSRLPLHAAAYEGHIDMVRLLLKWGADVNAVCNVNGLSTALSLAAEMCEDHIVDLLVRSGADPKIAWTDGDRRKVVGLDGDR